MNEKFCILIQISRKFGLDNGLVPNRRQAIIWTNADPIQWRIYAALGGDGLIYLYHQHMRFLLQKQFYAQLIWYATKICTLVDILLALYQSDHRIPNHANAKTMHSSSTNCTLLYCTLLWRRWSRGITETCEIFSQYQSFSDMSLHVKRWAMLNGITAIIRAVGVAHNQLIMTSLTKPFATFCYETWKTWHHGREFSIWWYSPLKNNIAHL